MIEVHRRFKVAPVLRLLLLRGPRLMLINAVLALEIFQICLALREVVLRFDHLLGLVV